MEQNTNTTQAITTASPSVEETVTFIMEGVYVNTADLIENSK